MSIALTPLKDLQYSQSRGGDIGAHNPVHSLFLEEVNLNNLNPANMVINTPLIIQIASFSKTSISHELSGAPKVTPVFSITVNTVHLLLFQPVNTS